MKLPKKSEHYFNLIVCLLLFRLIISDIALNGSKHVVDTYIIVTIYYLLINVCGYSTATGNKIGFV